MKNQHKLILISVLGTIMFLGLVMLVVKPSLNRVTKLNKDISIKKTELRQLEEQIIIYKNSQKDLLLASGKDVISSILIPRENLHIAIEEMEAAAKSSGVGEFLQIKEEADTPASTSAATVVPGKVSLDEIEYNITTNSGFVQLINFLKYLEHLPHFTEISKISIFATASSDDNPNAANLSTVRSLINSVFFVRKK